VAIMLAIPFKAEGFQAFSNPQDPLNPILYFIFILIFTFAILMIVKYKKQNIIRYMILGAITITMFYVFLLPLWYALFFLTSMRDVIAIVSSFGLAIGLTFVLYKYPEWYVVDFVGVIVAVGATAILGISLALLPALILLIALAVYDAISVYKTKHMITLADSVTELKLPVLLVIPKTSSYSFIKQKGLKDELKKEERDAMFMGLGDLVIPGVLIVSTFTFLSPNEVLPGIYTNFLVSISTLLGSLIGFFILMRYVSKGKPQAGLPLLNLGAIVGYLISYVILYQNLTFGINLNW
jgi:presenilin-like A22 family membrane protease